MFLNSPITELNRNILIDTFNRLEKTIKTDVIVFYGAFMNDLDCYFKNIIEKINSSTAQKHETLSVILTTYGGSLIPVKRIVNIIRKFYEKVDFYVPDYAYSAGTILCCSGDRIFMDYNSVLGPIDPQVPTKDGKWVSALGYLDKLNELLEKARNNELTNAEFLILKDFDLGEWRSYEQARDLAIDLLTDWLPKYKFKDWKQHKNKKEVTEEEKRKRAEEIAKSLGDNNKWKSHSRPINREELESLKLKIDHIEDNPPLYEDLKKYNELMVDYIRQYKRSLFIQARGILL